MIIAISLNKLVRSYILYAWKSVKLPVFYLNGVRGKLLAQNMQCGSTRTEIKCQELIKYPEYIASCTE